MLGRVCGAVEKELTSAVQSAVSDNNVIIDSRIDVIPSLEIIEFFFNM